jgi:hypothetical protein
VAIEKKQLEKERAELQVQHDGAATEAIAATLRSRIGYLDFKIALATEA